jgi:hypothetical protein
MNVNQHLLQSSAVAHALDLLDPRERRYVLQVTLGRLSKAAAANDAGYKNAPKSQVVQAAVQLIQTEMSRVLNIDLDFVQKGLLEAVEIARSQGEPATMIAGYREMGKLGGLYVEKKEVDVSVRYLTQEQLQELPEAELDHLIKRADAIELEQNEAGEFEVP